MPDLYDTYIDRSLEEYTPLEDFVGLVEAGEFGVFSKEERTAFLRRVESNMMANVETQIAARPELAERREEVIGQTRTRIQTLIDQLAD